LKVGVLSAEWLLCTHSADNMPIPKESQKHQSL
jgi:hypothetical protein